MCFSASRSHLCSGFDFPASKMLGVGKELWEAWKVAAKFAMQGKDETRASA